MRLLLKIGASVLLSVSMLLILQSFVGVGLKENNNFKVAYVSKYKIDADVLAHGSCESETMLDPAIIEKYVGGKVYNLALNHSDFADNYLLLNEYLKHQKKPSLVLLFAMPEAFDEDVTNTFNTFRFTHLLNDEEVKTTIKENDPEYAKLSWIPFLRYSYYSNFTFFKALDGWRNWIAKDTTTQWPTGYSTPNFPWQQASYTFGAENREPFHFRWSATRVKYFVKTLELLKKHDIKVLAYHSPIYHEALPLQKNRDEMLKKIDSVCKKFEVPYLQFDSLPMRFQRENYHVSINPTIPTYNNTIAGNLVFNNYFGRFLHDSLPSIFNRNNILKSGQNFSNTDIINKQK